MARCVGVMAKLILTLQASAPSPPMRGRPCPTLFRLPQRAFASPVVRLPRLPICPPRLRLAIGTSSAAVADFAADFGADFGARVAIMSAMYAPARPYGKQKTRARRYINARGRVLILRGAFFCIFFRQKALFFSFAPRNDNRARPRNSITRARNAPTRAECVRAASILSALFTRPRRATPTRAGGRNAPKPPQIRPLDTRNA